MRPDRLALITQAAQKNGDVFHGKFVKNCLTGKGIVTESDGTVFEGDFARSKLCGKGKVTINGKVYEGKVKNIMAFGAFVEFMPGKDGLLHISEISHDRIDSMEGVLKEGDKIEVKLIEVDKKTGKYRLSRKVLLGNRPERVAPEA